MTDNEIMAMSHDDLVQLFVLRRDDLKAANKEAARIRYNERMRDRYRTDPAFRARRDQKINVWRKNNREKCREYFENWYKNKKKNERDREKQKTLNGHWSVSAEPLTVADMAEATPHIIITPELLQIPKTVKPERTSSGAMPIPDFELTQVRTDKEAAAYWRQVIDDLEYRYFAKEIDVEAYFSGRNAAMSHLLAAEERMKPKRVRNY